MDGLTKMVFTLVLASGLTACGGDLANSLGANFSVTDTGVAGDISKDGVSVSDINLDIFLGSGAELK